MPTYTANQLQENYPRCPHCACTDLADLIREEILSFEIFVELDDLKLQEVLVELMREGPSGLFLQQAPLSVREHVRENLSSYNRDRLDDDIRVTATDTERREAIDRAVRPAWVMQIRGDVKLKLPAARLSVVGMCPVCKRATIALENLQGLATCPRVPWDRSLRYTCAGHSSRRCRRGWSRSSRGVTSTTFTSDHWRCCSRLPRSARWPPLKVLNRLGPCFDARQGRHCHRQPNT